MDVAIGMILLAVVLLAVVLQDARYYTSVLPKRRMSGEEYRIVRQHDGRTSDYSVKRIGSSVVYTRDGKIERIAIGKPAGWSI